ncbi:hypothetical protein Dfri01_48510 [Dyadobacter frigoris]|uniref:serine hydrolase domain-containing protein n=1 Tax=Dyadobacter frigoris TaxID=2576211 RepID=UPI0024A55B01|nr:serine hydrolase domain-containing protein [Dyadobacter frigoris]GLU55390.1 hypothetical protein Dfri01_48510 [Dyadobacter frigoris]
MTRFFLSAIWLLILIAFAYAPAQARHDTTPKNIEELKKMLTAEMDKQHVLGMMLTMVNKDSVLCITGLGFSDFEKKLPVNENVLFRGSSITKMFVAAAVLNLVKEGKLRLDSRLKDIAPNIRFKNNWEATSPITIDKLLEHTTGFSDKSPFEEYNFSSHSYTSFETVELFEKFMSSKWIPGQRHAYSNVNYAILDYVIEHVSGKSTKDYLKTEVFAKFGMPDANLNLTGDGTARYSKGYVWKGNGFSLVPHQPAFGSGYSSLNVSAVDLAYALKMYLNGWEQPYGKFLDKKNLANSEVPHTYLSAKAGLKNTYAYGNESNELEGITFRGHRGAIGGFLSAFLYNRALVLGYAFALNTHNEDFYRFADRLISQYLLRDTVKPVPAKVYPLNQQTIEPFLGYYRYANPSQLYSGFFESLTNTIQIKQTDHFLDVSIIGRGQMKWQATDENGRFYKNINATNPHISFLRDSAGNPAISDGTMYFEKISALQAWGPIILFVASAMLLTSALIFGLVNSILLILKKSSRKQWLLRLAPAFAALSLLLSLYVLSQLFGYMREALPMDGLHWAWMIGNYGFVIFTMISCVILVLQWRNIRSVLLKVYLAFTCVGGIYIIALQLVSSVI